MKVQKERTIIFSGSFKTEKMQQLNGSNQILQKKEPKIFLMARFYYLQNYFL